AYDWHADHRHLAAQLDAKIHQVKQRYGEQQKILLIAHSSSNCAIRYYLQQSATQKNRDSIAKWYAFGPPWVGTFQS
ncbi:lipase/acyltransferase domain-containing protein, partial [Escherichia coli]|uniref:lipase/acyltransferase domain-containing protein n=2 Tax=Enterobacterales TaxID=91347 RepID=UPI003F75B61E